MPSKKSSRDSAKSARLQEENEQLKARLYDAEQTLEAIRQGYVDALVIKGDEGEKVYALEGAERPYRVFFDQMTEGAATLSPDSTIIFVNRSLGKMLRRRDGLQGQRLTSFIKPGARHEFRSLMKEALTRPCNGEVSFLAKNGTVVPAKLWLNSLDIGEKKFICITAVDLTEMKRAERALNEAHSLLERRVKERTGELQNIKIKLETMINQMPVGVIIAEADSNADLVLNKEIKRIMHHPISTPITLSSMPDWIKALHVDGTPYRRQDYPLIRSLKKGEMVKQEEMLIRGENGNTRILRVSSAPIRDNSSKIVAALSASIDVTDLKNIEERLRASEEKANSLIRYAPTAIYEIDFRGPRFTKVNEAMSRITGYSEEQLLTMDATAIMDDRSKPLFMERIKKTLSGQKVDESVEYRVITKDGRELVATLNTTLTYKDGKPVGAFVIAHDITESKRIQEALKDSESRYRGLFEAVQEIFYIDRLIYDEQGNVIDWIFEDINPAGFALLGKKSMEEAKGKRGSEVLGKEVAKFYLPKIEEARKSGKAVKWAYKSPYVDKEFLTSYVVLGDRLISAQMDITEIRQAQRDTEEYAGKLRRSNEELQQFAYVASHDLQEPLRMVINYLSLLDRKYRDKLDSKAVEYINYAVDGGTRMRELIDDLLEYSRVQTQGREFAEVDMKDVTKRVLAVLKGPITDTGAEIIIEKLPTIFADESQLEQVMQNLIGNAIKFHGQEKPRISISATAGTSGWTFAVKDNGIGLDMQYADKIFQMFQRLHNREKYPGSGVGLAIVRKIIDRHGGRIWVESEEGKGATFFFIIPHPK